MGQHIMDNIHSPTVPSSSNRAAADRVSITDLIKEKDNLEAEMKALGSVLESHGVTMSTPLLTPDGFPRADLDIAQIRTTRSSIIHLQNDHKALLARIEPKLHEYFAANRPSTPPSNTGSSANPPNPPVIPNQPTDTASASSTSLSTPAPPSQQQQQQSSTSALTPPFALVNSVAQASPADYAGLEAGDEIHTFGSANWLNHEKLSLVAQIVRRSEGLVVPIVISRKDPSDHGYPESEAPKQVHRLTLVPKTGWGGRGALGCHLLPI